MHWLESINQASMPFILWVQSHATDGLTAWMRFFSFLGTEYFFLVLIPLVYWVFSKRRGILMALALSLASYLAGFIKWTFLIPRPPSPPVQRWWHETSPGFVSGHATTAMAVWGTWAGLRRRGWGWFLAGVLIFAIGFSRIYLGVHYPSDVVGGWLTGLIVAVGVLAGVPRLERRVRAWSGWGQAAAAVGLSLLLLAIFPGDATQPHWPAASAVQLSGLLLGFLLGLVWDSHRIHDRIPASWQIRLMRFGAGMVLLLAVYGLPKLFLSMFPPASYPLEQTLRYFRYALVGLTVSGLGPWFFKRFLL